MTDENDWKLKQAIYDYEAKNFNNEWKQLTFLVLDSMKTDKGKTK